MYRDGYCSIVQLEKISKYPKCPSVSDLFNKLPSTGVQCGCQKDNVDLYLLSWKMPVTMSKKADCKTASRFSFYFEKNTLGKITKESYKQQNSQCAYPVFQNFICRKFILRK